MDAAVANDTVMEVARFVEMFEEAEQSTYDARLNAERDRDYYNKIQLTDAETAELRKRGQPTNVFNQIRRKINTLKGIEVKRRVDPRAFPRTPQHEIDAEGATSALRFVASNTNFDKVRTLVWENMLIEGFGGAEVVHEIKNGQPEIVVNRYSWDRLFYDPHSAELDFSDARYLGTVVWADATQLKEEYTDKADDIQWTMSDVIAGETFDDKPRYTIWSSRQRNRVRVVMVWYLEKDEWHFCKYHKGGILEQGVSPYLNEDGKTVCPLVMQSMYVDRENQRHGFVRDMVDPQDEINKRRSKALHLLTMRQVVMEDGAVDSEAKVRRELARPDGVIKVGPGLRFDIQPQGDLAQGQVALLHEAKDEIDRMGANTALEGQTSESASGRAVMARQQGGMTELAADNDKLTDWTIRCYKQMWLRVRQFWTEPRWIRVTDDQDQIKWVGLNQQKTIGDVLREMDPQEAMMEAQQLGISSPQDPRLNMVAGVENSVPRMEMDIEIEEVPDQISLEWEQFQAITGLAPALMQANPALAPTIGELMIDIAPGVKSETRRKLRESIAKMEEQSAQSGAVQQQIVQQRAALEVEQAEADVDATIAKAQKDQAQAVAAQVNALTF